jgi:hypothetical protein
MFYQSRIGSVLGNDQDLVMSKYGRLEKDLI